VLIQAKRVESTENLKKMLICNVLSEISDETLKKSIRETAITQPEALIGHVIDYIKSKEAIIKSNGGIYGSRSRRFLLVFDNVEELIKSSKDDFRNLLSNMLNKCPMLSIVVTTRRWMINDEITSSCFTVLSEL
jgi:hypothetical protein